MGSLFYIFAYVILITWAVAYVAFGAGPRIHLLILLAAVVVLFRIFQRKPL